MKHKIVGILICILLSANVSAVLGTIGEIPRGNVAEMEHQIHLLKKAIQCQRDGHILLTRMASFIGIPIMHILARNQSEF
jgi:hypothetical protein